MAGSFSRLRVADPREGCFDGCEWAVRLPRDPYLPVVGKPMAFQDLRGMCTDTRADGLPPSFGSRWLDRTKLSPFLVAAAKNVEDEERLEASSSLDSVE